MEASMFGAQEMLLIEFFSKRTDYIRVNVLRPPNFKRCSRSFLGELRTPVTFSFSPPWARDRCAEHIAGRSQPWKAAFQQKTFSAVQECVLVINAGAGGRPTSEPVHSRVTPFALAELPQGNTAGGRHQSLRQRTVAQH